MTESEFISKDHSGTVWKTGCRGKEAKEGDWSGVSRIGDLSGVVTAYVRVTGKVVSSVLEVQNWRCLYKIQVEISFLINGCS